MSTNELATYVLEIALTYSKDAFPAGDHVVRLPYGDRHATIWISVDLISSIEYRFANNSERREMQDYIKAKIEAFMEEAKNGTSCHKLDLELPCD